MRARYAWCLSYRLIDLTIPSYDETTLTKIPLADRIELSYTTKVNSTEIYFEQAKIYSRDSIDHTTMGLPRPCSQVERRRRNDRAERRHRRPRKASNQMANDTSVEAFRSSISHGSSMLSTMWSRSRRLHPPVAFAVDILCSMIMLDGCIRCQMETEAVKVRKSSTAPKHP
jgi:uncharacterized protein with von Willebrand factor type A (vWA) domain